MTGSTIVWLAVVVALFSQLLLIAHVARRWPSIPREVPYGTLPGGRYFWWGPRAIVWSAPAVFIIMIAATAGIIWQTPILQRQPLMAIPFVLLALTTPLMQRSIDEKIDAAIRRDP
jgi:hypothetical protein